MSKTVHEIRMEKLRDWEIREMVNRHAVNKAWWLCGISLGVGLLLYPLLCKFDLMWMGILLAVICGHIFVYNIVELLQLEREQQQHNAELDLLTKLDNRDV